MFTNIIILLFLVAIAAGLVWLIRRAWGTKRLWVKWTGVVLGSLLALVLVLAIVTGSVGMYKLYSPHTLAAPDSTAPSAPDQIARGEHLALVACAGCHATNDELPLSGGSNLSAETGLPLGNLYAPNITSAGHIHDMSDGEIFRAVRTGLSDDKRATVMSSAGTRFLSDGDIWAIVAYLRNSQPVKNETPEFKPSLLLAILTGAGLVKLDVPSTLVPVTSPAKAASAEYGRYVAAFMGCADCHGENMDGQVKPPAPQGTNLRASIPKWSEEQFSTAMRTGAEPSGYKMNEVMPWRSIGKLDDIELVALYEYLHGLPMVVSK